MNERSLSARWRNVGVVSVVYAAASPRAPPLNEPPLSSERPLHGSWLSLLLAMLHWEKRTGSSGPAAEPGDSLPLLSLEGHGGGLGESLSDTPESFKMRLPKRMSAPRRDNVLRCGRPRSPRRIGPRTGFPRYRLHSLVAHRLQRSGVRSRRFRVAGCSLVIQAFSSPLPRFPPAPMTHPVRVARFLLHILVRRRKQRGSRRTL